MNIYSLLTRSLLPKQGRNLACIIVKAITVRYENKDVIVEAEQNFDIAKKVDREIFFFRIFVNYLLGTLVIP
jgi:hypothetical protein